MERLCSLSKPMQPQKVVCLNPCSNGTTLLILLDHYTGASIACLNPCSNGTTLLVVEDRLEEDPGLS